MDSEYRGSVIKNSLLLVLGTILTIGSYSAALPGESYIVCSGMIFVSLYNLIRLGYHYLSWEVPFFYFLRGKGIMITIMLFAAISILGIMAD